MLIWEIGDWLRVRCVFRQGDRRQEKEMRLDEKRLLTSVVSRLLCHVLTSFLIKPLIVFPKYSCIRITHSVICRVYH